MAELLLTYLLLGYCFELVYERYLDFTLTKQRAVSCHFGLTYLNTLKPLMGAKHLHCAGLSPSNIF